MSVCHEKLALPRFASRRGLGYVPKCLKIFLTSKQCDIDLQQVMVMMMVMVMVMVKLTTPADHGDHMVVNKYSPFLSLPLYFPTMMSLEREKSVCKELYRKVKQSPGVS